MTGTEKQIAYANSLRDNAIEAYNNAITVLSSEESWYDDPNTEESRKYIAMVSSRRDEIAAFDGDAGKFIDWFKAVSCPSGSVVEMFGVVQSCYKRWETYNRLHARRG